VQQEQSRVHATVPAPGARDAAEKSERELLPPTDVDDADDAGEDSETQRFHLRHRQDSCRQARAAPAGSSRSCARCGALSGRVGAAI
jgi:hypothetical protein